MVVFYSNTEEQEHLLPTRREILFLHFPKLKISLRIKCTLLYQQCHTDTDFNQEVSDR
jgi:hypothetical protein